MVAELEELLVKLIRLVANISICAEVGSSIVQQPGIQVLVPLLHESLASNREELLLNVVSCITNLSYYGTSSASVGGGGGALERHAGEGKEGEEKDGEEKDGGGGGSNCGRALHVHASGSGSGRVGQVLFSAHRAVIGDLVGVLVHPNDEAVAEAARAFGNLSRDTQIRRFMAVSEGRRQSTNQSTTTVHTRLSTRRPRSIRPRRHPIDLKFPNPNP